VTDQNLSPPLRADADEIAVIGACLIDPSHVGLLKLSAEDFFGSETREAWAAMSRIVERGDLPIFTSMCAEISPPNATVKPSTLCDWVARCPTSIYARHYARNVQRAAQRRRLLSASGGVASVASDPAITADRAVSLASTLVSNVRGDGSPSSEVVEPLEAIGRFAAAKSAIRDGRNSGLATGYLDLDTALSGGLRPGQLMVIGARPGVGKSAMMRDIARAMSFQGRVLYASNEMGALDLTDRDVAVLAEVALSTIVGGRWGSYLDERINQAKSTLEFMPLTTLADGSMTSESLRARTIQLHAQEPFACVVVDYLQRMADGGHSDLERVGRTARALKSLALELGVPVIAGSQLSRTTERDNPDTRPGLIDLRNSGEIEQEADIVGLLYRSGYHYPTEDHWRKAGKSGRYPGNEAELTIAKQRQGPSGLTIRLLWVPSLATFRNLARQ
jgi:replicative DNA helicase